MMSSGTRAAGTPGTRISSVNGVAMTTSSGGDASGLLETMQTHVDDIRSHLQCGICIRPLYEPFTIACGHTFCYSCLSAWFTSNQSCPDCRSPVKVQPAPAYLIRALVQIFTSRPELLENGETTAEHKKLQREEAQRLENDKADTNPRTGGLFKGTFKPKPPIQQPVLDLEDNVLRCPECSWELEEDECVHCGYFAGSVDDLESMSGAESRNGLSDAEEHSVMTYYDDDDDDDYDDDDDDDQDVVDYALAAMPPNSRNYYGISRYPPYPNNSRYPGMTGAPSDLLDDYDNEDDEGEDYSDDADMDSFIDDDLNDNGQHESESESDRSTVVGAHEYSTQDHYDDFPSGTQGSTSQVEDDISEYSGEDVSQSETNDEGGVYEDQEDEEDEEDRIQPAVTRRMQGYNGRITRRTRCDGPPLTQIFNTNQPCVQLTRQPQQNRGSTSLDAIPVDDDDDDDDVPVAPVRRTRVRQNFRFAAY